MAGGGEGHDYGSPTPQHTGVHGPPLHWHLNNTVLLKREDTQPVFSFKIRGAYNKMANLSRSELDGGVVACSAGNHAQGVAMSARMLKCKATIVMPLATPAIKVNAVRVHGGPTVEIRLFGNNYDEAAIEAQRLVREEGMAMIHPFDDPYVIAGQGTIGMEILKECVGRPLEAIFVCCGGGNAGGNCGLLQEGYTHREGDHSVGRGRDRDDHIPKRGDIVIPRFVGALRGRRSR